jgi:hypothetical protein
VSAAALAGEVLPERTTERHVDDLDAAANAEHGEAACPGNVDESDLELVARGVHRA